MSGELERVVDVVDDREPWVDPIDENFPPALRPWAKAMRATFLLYVMLRNADRVEEFLTDFAARVDALLEEARADVGGAG